MQNLVIVFDMDDTLYDEIDFVYSGFHAVSKFCNPHSPMPYYHFMVDLFHAEGSGLIFNKVLTHFNLELSLESLINTYRFHQPNISLSSSAKTVLKECQKYEMALITDGTYKMQYNKYQALNLKSYIDYPIFSSLYHTSKPDILLFEKVMEKFPNHHYAYIADNPKKDFIGPNQLQWKTIRYKNPRGIYQTFENDAQYEITSLTDCINIIKSWS